MANRSKPYPLWLAILDTILVIATKGGWLVGILIRELYRWKADPK